MSTYFELLPMELAQILTNEFKEYAIILKHVPGLSRAVTMRTCVECITKISLNCIKDGYVDLYKYYSKKHQKYHIDQVLDSQNIEMLSYLLDERQITPESLCKEYIRRRCMPIVKWIYEKKKSEIRVKEIYRVMYSNMFDDNMDILITYFQSVNCYPETYDDLIDLVELVILEYDSYSLTRPRCLLAVMPIARKYNKTIFGIEEDVKKSMASKGLKYRRATTYT